ncbi:hypothetical protein [Pseudooceanicola sp. LIPI14-2-Ac024]|uniref:hypothetical protein n=1 Tax=Pseudooceanicola sp. LIPI14-2-Ac024 TaxID=3344875 RepID=UPI0035D0F3E8
MPDPALPGIGHNNGPSMDGGRTRRIHQWARAKAQVQPQIPVEIVRMRMRRAADLGMSYRTYASVRTTAGRDVAALVFTSNALGLHRGGELPGAVAERLSAIRSCLRVGLLTAPLDPVSLNGSLPLDRLYRAPASHARWPVLREAMARVQEGLPAQGLVLVGAAPGEAEWAAAGRLGAYLDARAYFGA